MRAPVTGSRHGSRIALAGRTELNCRTVTHVEVDSTARAARAGTVGRTLRSLLLVVLVTTITAPVVLLSRPAGADQTSDLQARATQLSEAMLRQQLQVGAYSQLYQQSTAKVAADAQLLGADQAKVAVDQRRIALDRDRLQTDAVDLYLEYGSSATNTSLFQSADAVQRQREYLTVAFGDTAVAIDQLNLARATLDADRTSVEHQQQADQAAQSAAASQLHQAQLAQSTLASDQAQVNGQLATVIAQQQAAEEAQAVAARAAAAASAGSSSTATAPAPSGGGTPAPTGGDPGGAGATSDPTLPPFLVCVRQVNRAVTTRRCRPTVSTWGPSSSPSPPGTTPPRSPGCPAWSACPQHGDQGRPGHPRPSPVNADGDQPWYGDCGSG